MHQIHDLTSAKIFRIAEEGTEWIGVTAVGISSCLGWRNPILSPWLYTEKPADNMQDFDFCAEEPARTTHSVHAPVAADHLIERSRIDYWGEGNDLAGIRIHSSQNEIEARFSDADAVDAATLPLHIQTAGVPWSWLGGREMEAAASSTSKRPANADRLLTSIIGTRLRVLENTDQADLSSAAGRTTVRIHPTTRVIESVWIG